MAVFIPCTSPISSHWKIHYFTAEMAERAEHRAEDAEFLENMPGVLGPRAMTALEQIQSTLGLDYAGIDFGLSPLGDLLLFEANATMVVNPPEPDERWAYRRPASGADFRRRPRHAAAARHAPSYAQSLITKFSTTVRSSGRALRKSRSVSKISFSPRSSCSFENFPAVADTCSARDPHICTPAR